MNNEFGISKEQDFFQFNFVVNVANRLRNEGLNQTDVIVYDRHFVFLSSLENVRTSKNRLEHFNSIHSTCSWIGM